MIMVLGDNGMHISDGGPTPNESDYGMFELRENDGRKFPRGGRWGRR